MDRDVPGRGPGWPPRDRSALQRAARRRRERHRRLLTRLVLPVVVLAVFVGAFLLVRGGTPAPTSGSRVDAAAGHAAGTAARSTTTTTTTTVPPTTTTTVDPGSLPQTTQLPTVDSQFDSEINSLWIGITTNSLTAAMPAFFPEGAYLQLKTLSNDQQDFQDRLVAEYGQDITAAYQLLSSVPGPAKLLGVLVPEQYAHWVPPGVCDNSIGYYEVANSRLVYQQDGQERSFGIASLISWRGEWYVVHLGAILRPGTGGVVLDPQLGTGTSPPSTTC